MVLLDMAWKKDKRYYHYEGFREVIHDDAPKWVKDSYKRYLEQIYEKEARGAAFPGQHSI